MPGKKVKIEIELDQDKKLEIDIIAKDRIRNNYRNPTDHPEKIYDIETNNLL